MSSVSQSTSMSQTLLYLEVMAPQCSVDTIMAYTPLLLGFKTIDVSDSLLKNIWECELVDPFMTLFQRRRREEGDGRIHHFPKGFCSEAEEGGSCTGKPGDEPSLHSTPTPTLFHCILAPERTCPCLERQNEKGLHLCTDALALRRVSIKLRKRPWDSQLHCWMKEKSSESGWF